MIARIVFLALMLHGHLPLPRIGQGSPVREVVPAVAKIVQHIDGRI